MLVAAFRYCAFAAVALFLLAGCDHTGDTIAEIESGVNGTKVETRDGREYYLRHDVYRRCDSGDRLWECANRRRDLLVERT